MTNADAHTYVVILCGGGGTRLWPLSRNQSPKQFIELVETETLFTKTLKRAQRLVADDHIYIMTNQAYLADVHKYASHLPTGNIITEPEKKNTALAMGVAAGIIHARDPQAVIINLASDQLITDDEVFVRSMLAAAAVAGKREYFVTVGITPAFAHTGLGYIHADGELYQEAGLPVLAVEGFREKPDQATAEKFVASGEYYWNANLYTWATDVILAEFASLAPEISASIAEIMAAVGKPTFTDTVAAVYKNATEAQIDTAISEHTHKLAMIPGNFGWTDIGSWNVVHDEAVKDGEGNALIARDPDADWFSIDTKNSLVSTGKKQIVTLGLENIIIVDTPDALLVTHKDRAQDVKKVVEHLKSSGKETLL